MNTQLLRKFSREILSGANSLGIVADHPGGGILSPDQATALEQKTGRPIGELAVIGIEHAASPEQKKEHGKLLRETTELMACLDNGLRPLSTKTARKAAVR